MWWNTERKTENNVEKTEKNSEISITITSAPNNWHCITVTYKYKYKKIYDENIHLGEKSLSLFRRLCSTTVPAFRL